MHLRKRDNFRAAFAGFDFNKVAAFTDEDVERLLGLHAAKLLKASFDPPIRELSGEVYIARACVSEVTAEGFSALARARRQQPEHFDDRSPRRPRARRLSKIGDAAGEEKAGPA